jgi:regulator of sigma E protease
LVLTILAVVLGLGFVIFVHELGHFLLAKWNGVKVEVFALGFGPIVWGFRRGETLYGIAALPLGGYVKMLGEGESSEDPEKAADPRSYSNQPVGARMAIISAGVIMNLIFGLICFVVVYLRGGKLETPATLGGVVAGQPAYEAGLRIGDEVIAVDGQPEVDFLDLKRIVALSGAGQKIRLTIRRPGVDQPFVIAVEPKREATDEQPSIGILPVNDLTLTEDAPPFLAPPGMVPAPEANDAGFLGGDRIVAVGPVGQAPTPVADIFALDRLLAKSSREPLAVVVERKGKNTARATVTLPPVHFVDFGFRLTAEPVSSIAPDTPAVKAGFEKGDRIITVDGIPLNGNADFDPMYLPTYCYDHAGQVVTFEVERPGPNGKSETLTLQAIPNDSPPWTEVAIRRTEPLEVPGLGLAYPISPRIAAVKDGSPAAKAGLKPGQVIRSLTLWFKVTQKPEKKWWFWGKEAQPPDKKPEELKFLDPEETYGWPFAFRWIQDPARMSLTAPERAVTLAIEGLDDPIRLTPELAPNWFHPWRGFRLEPLERPMPPLGLGSAFQRGARETWDNITAVYFLIRGLIQKRVGTKNVGGPILIATLAYSAASLGLTTFLYFLGMLSVNLAVINFLPIGPLDGGQMLLLLAEKVRGRPLPESAQAPFVWLGVFFLLCLMILVFYQDIRRTIF